MARRDPNEITLSVRIPKALNEQLKKAAAAESRKRSDQVRMIIRQFVKQAGIK